MYVLAIKNNEIISFVSSWRELEGITLSKTSQKENDEYQILSFICIWKERQKTRAWTRHGLLQQGQELGGLWLIGGRGCVGFEDSVHPTRGGPRLVIGVIYRYFKKKGKKLYSCDNSCLLKHHFSLGR